MNGQLMQAAVYHGPHDLRVESRLLPTIGSDEALLRVVNAGICGTDLRIWHGGHRQYPAGTIRIPGHEVVGDIAQVGANLIGLEVGQRVLVAPNMGCGHCRQCVGGNNNLCHDYRAIGITMDGAFAEYLRIPAEAIWQGNLIPVARETDPATAVLIEPFACVLRGQDVLNIRAGDIVLVVGDGPIGLMHVILARLQGAGRIVVSGHHPARLAYALEAGADRAIDSRQESLAAIVAEVSEGRGADVVIIAAPTHEAQQEALELAVTRGRINFFGGLPKNQSTIQVDSNLVHYKELRITGTTGCSTNDCWRAAALINSGQVKLSGMVSARFSLSEAPTAFAAAEDRKSLKVVIEP